MWFSPSVFMVKLIQAAALLVHLLSVQQLWHVELEFLSSVLMGGCQLSFFLASFPQQSHLNTSAVRPPKAGGPGTPADPRTAVLLFG